MPEHMTIHTSKLSDTYLEAVARFAHELAGEPNGEARTFGQELLSAVRRVQTIRGFVWLDFVDGTGFPDWDTCVAALRGDVGDEA